MQDELDKAYNKLDNANARIEELERELKDEKQKSHQQMMQFCELYKLMPEIENQYPDRLYYHLANYLNILNLSKRELTTLRAECEGFAEALRVIIKSATPHPMQNPTMYSAWIKADDMLTRHAAIAKGKESGE